MDSIRNVLIKYRIEQAEQAITEMAKSIEQLIKTEQTAITVHLLNLIKNEVLEMFDDMKNFINTIKNHLDNNFNFKKRYVQTACGCLK